MGFSYSRGQLCCDGCPTGKGRKRRCPSGYCPSAALCAACFAKEKASGKWVAYHAKCAERSAEFKALEARTSALLAAGELVRCSALSADGDKVYVLFRNATGSTTGFYVDTATYRAIPLGVPATPADYAAIGPLTPAPANFQRAALRPRPRVLRGQRGARSGARRGRGRLPLQARDQGARDRRGHRVPPRGDGSLVKAGELLHLTKAYLAARGEFHQWHRPTDEPLHILRQRYVAARAALLEALRAEGLV